MYEDDFPKFSLLELADVLTFNRFSFLCKLYWRISVDIHRLELRKLYCSISPYKNSFQVTLVSFFCSNIYSGYESPETAR